MAYWLLQTDDNVRPDNQPMNICDPLLARQSFQPELLPEIPPVAGRISRF
jgi:hypothetical protein